MCPELQKLFAITMTTEALPFELLDVNEDASTKCYDGCTYYEQGAMYVCTDSLTEEDLVTTLMHKPDIEMLEHLSDFSPG